MYLIYGTNDYLIDLEVKKIIKNKKALEISFDESATFNNIFKAVTNISFFEQRKVIVVKNHSLLTEDHFDSSDIFIDALKNHSENIEIVFQINNKKINSKNPVIKFLFNEAIINEYNELNDQEIIKIMQDYVEQKGGKLLYRSAVNMMYKMQSVDLYLYINELNKLLSYDLNINDDLINAMTLNAPSKNYFAFSNAILENNKTAIVEHYYSSLKKGDTPLSIIGRLSSIFVLAQKVLMYKEKHHSLTDISQTLKVHVFRIKKIDSMISSFSKSRISNILSKLYDFDLEIKKGMIQDQVATDYLILQLLAY